MCAVYFLYPINYPNLYPCIGTFLSKMGKSSKFKTLQEISE